MSMFVIVVTVLNFVYCLIVFSYYCVASSSEFWEQEENVNSK